MKILEVMPKEAILSDLKATDKKGVLEELVAPVAQVAGLNPERLVRILLEREHLGSTGIDGGIGIPHGKVKELEKPVLGCGISHNGVDFESIDGKPTHIFFLLVTPENATGLHLRLLAHISKLLKQDLFKEQLLRAVNSDDIYQTIAQADEAN